MTDPYQPAAEADLVPLGDLLSWAFAFPRPDAEPWLRRARLENVRTLRRDGRIAACLVQIPMGQFFGGESVPMVGIAGVATAAEARGTGAGVEVMRRTLQELSARGVALSTLYAATRPLYRGVGYEAAGSHLELTVPLTNLEATDRTMPVRAVVPEDEPLLEELYRAHASQVPGHVDRGPYVWSRVKTPRASPTGTRGFVVGKGRPEGYVFFFEKQLASLHYDLHVTDLVARTPAAYARLLTLLADHGTLGQSMHYAGTLSDPILQLLPDHQYRTGALEHWMMRVVDVRAALERRGYALREADVELELDVRDELLPANAGRYVLRVSGGRGTVRHGGGGALRLDVRALSPLYSGHLTARTLASIGQLDAEPDALAHADGIFTSPHPWMPDFF